MDVLSHATEARRVPIPGAEPMGLAMSETTLWVACREAHRLYAMDPVSCAIVAEIRTPGAPFGLSFFQKKLYVVIGHGYDDDDRYLYRFTREGGFEEDRIACPDLSGVHLPSNGETLFLSQAYNRKILGLNPDGTVVNEISLDRAPVTGDREFQNLQLGRLDSTDGTWRRLTPLASMPFVARDLANDAKHFWTVDRHKMRSSSSRRPRYRSSDMNERVSRRGAARVTRVLTWSVSASNHLDREILETIASRRARSDHFADRRRCNSS